MDCFETDDPHELLVVVELAGVDPESIEIAVEERSLTISGERARPRVEGQVYQQAEIEYGRFERTHPARARHRPRRRERASYEAGCSGITLPIAERARAAAPVAIAVRRNDERDAARATSRLPVLPLKETVVFPESMTPLAVGQERSIRLIDDVVSGRAHARARCGAQPRGRIRRAGTISTRSARSAVVHKMIKVPDGTLRILVQGLHRVRLVEPEQDEPYLVAEVEELPDVVPDSPEVEALTRNVQTPVRRRSSG